VPTFRNKINELSGLGLGGFDFRTHINAITGNGTPVPYQVSSLGANVSLLSAVASGSVNVTDANVSVQSTGATATVSGGSASVTIDSGDGIVCL
jgi:hypothetical protein